MRVNLRRFGPRCAGYAEGMPGDHDDLEHRSEELKEHIDDARRKAQQDGLLPDPEHHRPTFADPDADGEDEITGAQGGL
jgi:hypothetical protein